MPTNKKRVNLALSDEVYDRLQKYKERNGISSDAGACVMLIIRQLDAIDQDELMMKAVSKFSLEELKLLSDIGLSQLKMVLEDNSKP